jgi:hypothetical protein
MKLYLNDNTFRVHQKDQLFVFKRGEGESVLIVRIKRYSKISSANKMWSYINLQQVGLKYFSVASIAFTLKFSLLSYCYYEIHQVKCT